MNHSYHLKTKKILAADLMLCINVILSCFCAPELNAHEHHCDHVLFVSFRLRRNLSGSKYSTSSTNT